MAEENKTEEKSKLNLSPRWKIFLAFVWLVLALAYDVSPIDLIPDVIPVFGWSDDVLVTLVAAFNLFRQFRKPKES